MPVAAKTKKIDELMEQASASLQGTRYFEAERLALKALGMAHQADDFERMGRIILPLQEARRQRLQQALDTGRVTVLDEAPLPENLKPKPGCFLVRPPLVGADAKRYRLTALEQEVPVAVVCREPTTQMGLVPIVAIGACGSIRTKVRPPKNADAPDLAWLVHAMEDLGNAAVESVDPGLEPHRRVNALVDYLDAVPDHERLHAALEEACREAHQAQVAREAAPSKRASRSKSKS